MARDGATCHEPGSGSSGILSTAVSHCGGAGNFSAGFGDANEGNGTPTNGGITGTYSFDVSGDGYGSAALTFTNTPDITSLGVYATDPNLNLADPNNTDLDLEAHSSSILTATRSRPGSLQRRILLRRSSGNYAVDYQAPDLSDLTGQVFSDGVSNVTGSGSLNDLFFTGQNIYTVTATFAPDAANRGRINSDGQLWNRLHRPVIVAYQAHANGEARVRGNLSSVDRFRCLRRPIKEPPNTWAWHSRYAGDASTLNFGSLVAHAGNLPPFYRFCSFKNLAEELISSFSLPWNNEVSLD